MGWKCIEKEELCLSSTPYPPISNPFFKNDSKDIVTYPTSHYDDVVFNYETYFYCQREVHQTKLILKNLEGDYFNNQLLDYDNINHDEALCFLLGINVGLTSTLTLRNEKLLSVFDYEVDFYDVSINGLLFRSKEHQLLKRKFGTSTINTKEFIDWAIDQNHIKITQDNPTHAKTIARNKNLAKVKKTLVEYLSEANGQTNTYNLSINKDFHSALSNNGLNVEESGMDANEINSKKGANITPTTLGDYIKEILNSNWWKNDLETLEIRRKLKKPLKNKSKK
jgi:hypothetical protein